MDDRNMEHVKATGQAWFVCFVLTLAFAFNYIDRSIISILVTPIKHDFGVSDTLIGLLQGGAFAVFLVLFGLPLSRFADRGNRRNLLLLGTAVWCGATMACGLANTVPELFLARIAVAIGEASLMPCAVSMLSDSFSPLQRARAFGIYSMGSYLGGAMANIGGGTLLHALGTGQLRLPLASVTAPWKGVFLLVGFSGFVLIPLLLVVGEPQRLADSGKAVAPPASISRVIAEYQRKRSALFTSIFGFSFVSMAAVTLAAWVPTLFVRTHHWEIKQVGIRLGLIGLIFAPIGAITGGFLADRLTRQGRKDAKMLLGACGAFVCLAATFLITLRSDSLALTGLGIGNFAGGLSYGLSQATLSDLMPNRMRAQTTAVYSLVNNLLAASLGPLMVGVLNDRVFHDPGKIALSMRIVLVVAFSIAGSLLWIGRRPVRLAQETTSKPLEFAELLP